MRSSYQTKDVTILLKDITGLLKPLDAGEREKKIQSGVHYSEMLPVEYSPTLEYKKLYEEALNHHAVKTAQAVAVVSEKIVETKKNRGIVLVSLARAGTPIGILIKRYLKKKFNINVPHYAISIIRGRGIDKNAMKFILKNHSPEEIQFVDGWIGKGAIIKELEKEMKEYTGISAELAVLADPARLTGLYGTSEDFLIPSACLNATVSGLFSRTVLNNSVISQDDYHGAVYYEALRPEDMSYAFIEAVEKEFPQKVNQKKEGHKCSGFTDVENILKKFDISDINLIKPGIGETTRVLMRRIPWKILVRDKTDTEYIGHILRLCEEKGIEAEEYPFLTYRACGIIKNVSADI